MSGARGEGCPGQSSRRRVGARRCGEGRRGLRGYRRAPRARRGLASSRGRRGASPSSRLTCCGLRHGAPAPAQGAARLLRGPSGRALEPAPAPGSRRGAPAGRRGPPARRLGRRLCTPSLPGSPSARRARVAPAFITSTGRAGRAGEPEPAQVPDVGHPGRPRSLPSPLRCSHVLGLFFSRG